MSQFNRPLPIGQDYYYPPPPRSSTWRFDDWQAALPGDFYVRTALLPTISFDYHHFEKSPRDKMSPCSSEREGPLSDGPKCRGASKRGGGDGRAERSRKEKARDEGRRDDGEQSKQSTEMVRVPPRPNPKIEVDRERRLIEMRLLLQQLHEQLQTAYNAYKPLLDEFASQIEQLSDFADKNTLDKIWINKLRAESQKMADAVAKDSTAERQADLNTITAQVNLCLRHLRIARRERMPEVPGFRNKDAFIENQIDLVISVVEDILDLSREASTDYSACQEIVPCLGRARDLTRADSLVWHALLERRPAAHEISPLK